jgi:hypothetical protein
MVEDNSVEILLKAENNGQFSLEWKKSLANAIEWILDEQIYNGIEVEFTKAHFNSINGLFQLIFHATRGLLIQSDAFKLNS